jgi:hypothetical protein
MTGDVLSVITSVYQSSPKPILCSIAHYIMSDKSPVKDGYVEEEEDEGFETAPEDSPQSIREEEFKHSVAVSQLNARNDALFLEVQKLRDRPDERGPDFEKILAKVMSEQQQISKDMQMHRDGMNSCVERAKRLLASAMEIKQGGPPQSPSLTIGRSTSIYHGEVLDEQGPRDPSTSEVNDPDVDPLGYLRVASLRERPRTPGGQGSAEESQVGKSNLHTASSGPREGTM